MSPFSWEMQRKRCESALVCGVAEWFLDPYLTMLKGGKGEPSSHNLLHLIYGQCQTLQSFTINSPQHEQLKACKIHLEGKPLPAERSSFPPERDSLSLHQDIEMRQATQ